MRIEYGEGSHCCGCSACVSACPVSAIRMIEDANGFISPRIDESVCIDCGKCSKICDFNKLHPEQPNSEKAFSLVIKDKDVLKKSTSGGAFSAFSSYIKNKSGYIVGSVFEDDFTLRHVITRDTDVCEKMRGSKYIQSNTQGVFEKVKELLTTDDLVLFTGTPCQCGALKSFLGKEYDNLYVIDLICHGVPNNRLFKDHIAFLEKVYKTKIKGYYFRDKKYGWNAYNNSVLLEGGKTVSKWINQVYYSFFVKNVSLRPSCYQCPYRSQHRQGDITIADFWGYEKVTGEKQNNTGISLVFANSKKGLDMIEQCGDVASIQEVNLSRALKTIHLNQVKSKIDRRAFWSTYQNGGYAALVKSYFDTSLSKRLRYSFRKVGKIITRG